MAEMTAGLRLVFATSGLRVLMLLGWLAALTWREDVPVTSERGLRTV